MTSAAVRGSLTLCVCSTVQCFRKKEKKLWWAIWLFFHRVIYWFNCTSWWNDLGGSSNFFCIFVLLLLKQNTVCRRLPPLSLLITWLWLFTNLLAKSISLLQLLLFQLCWWAHLSLSSSSSSVWSALGFFFFAVRPTESESCDVKHSQITGEEEARTQFSFSEMSWLVKKKL